MTAPSPAVPGESGVLVGPVEGEACPGCGLVPLIDKPDLPGDMPWRTRSALRDLWDGHYIGCPSIGTCAQFGPPWPSPPHREDDYLVGPWTVQASRAHLRKAHQRRAAVSP